MTVLEEVKYRLEGYCCKCGDCCRFLYCVEPLTELGFKFMKLIYPKYRRFKIIGKDKNGIILACKLIREDGLCPDYENRPDICRDYPNPKKIYAGGRLYKRCTYKLLPGRTFEDFLLNEEEGQEQSTDK
ncbi:MAG: hypothetical protein A2Y25_02310 [Candidatus Melainabacteria bacterium GWF2_37_15]|nr:MAG: hypothetical protein A2Y25_02310 [Candidatus Melainabacteria bacterium GWF2_37_15]